MRRLVLLRVVLVVLLMGVALAGASRSVGSARPRWVMTDLGTLGGRFSVAWAINDHGQILGASRTAGRVDDAFLWDNGKMVDLGRYGSGNDAGRSSVPLLLLNEHGHVVWLSGQRWLLWQHGNVTALTFNARAVNDRGEIVGARKAPWRAVAWRKGRLHDIGMIPGDQWSEASATNNVGMIAGTSYDGLRARAFLWAHGTLHVLPPPAGFQRCTAIALNDRGQVLGVCSTTGKRAYRVHGVLWDAGKTRDLGGGTWLYPSALNNLGQVAGRFEVSGVTHGFFWDSGNLRDLGALGRLGEVVAISNRSEVVGARRTKGRLHGFVWKNGVMTQLGRSGALSTSAAFGINDVGQIVGYSKTGQRADGENEQSAPHHAVLWTLRSS